MASLEYRRALTQHSSVVGLVIALHDTLAGDLRRAADAMRRNDIETRCEQLIHGFQVLTQLESMLDMQNGGPAAASIKRFYKHLRNQMLTAQFKLSPEILEEQIKIVLEVRQTWQMVDVASIERAPGTSTDRSAARRRKTDSARPSPAWDSLPLQNSARNRADRNTRR
jgi:flagellar protein FliS